MNKQHPRKEKNRSAKSKVIIAGAIAFLLLLVSCYSSAATQFYSGDSYSFKTQPPPSGETYSYKWSASDGSSSDYTNQFFNWTAPAVDAPKNVAINVTVIARGGCSASREMDLTIYPKSFGKISLEKSLDGGQNDASLGATISYTINITNTGQTDVVYLPLADNYPNEFFKPVSSNPQWDLDSGSALRWNNLLSAPLAPGRSIKVSASFHVINATNQPVSNLASVESAKDDIGAALPAQEASSTINGIKYECQKLGPDTTCEGVVVPFSAHLNLPNYRWKALDAQSNSAGEFDDPTKADVKWTPPGPGTFNISFNNFVCEQTITVRQCNSSIRINKNSEPKSPVRVGDTVTYIYNVTNTGDLPLKDVLVTDVQDWGPGCTPGYARGDDGNNILDPSETWRYECVYRIPDPLDYQRLTIMSNQSESARQEMIIQKLMNSRARLAIMLNKLKQLRSGFNMSLAQKTVGNVKIQGVYYIRYNYTDKLAGEVLIETLDQSGAIKSSMYTDPISGSSLTTEYGNRGQTVSDDYNSSLTKEALKIEYDKPAKGYMTYTIIDHSNGDSIIIIMNSNGAILSKQYRKTPGEMIFKAHLKNVATVTATDTRGATVSDIAAYLLEIERPLPELGIEKKAEPDPVHSGKTLTYTISYRNLGNETAHSAVINENYDKNVTFAYSSPLPDAGSNNIWSLGDLAKGVYGKITINVKVNPSVQNGTLLVNTAGISCAENIKANASANTTVLEATPLLQINKTASQDLISAGEPFSYTITYRNIGRVNATNVSIDDIVDQNLIFLDSNPKPSINNSFHMIWNSTRLKATVLLPGASGTIVMNMQAKPSIPKSVKWACNLYKISSNETQDIYKSLCVPVIHSLYVRKTAERSTYSPGALVNYIIKYGNEGDLGVATKVKIKDTLPDVEFVEASPMPTSIQGRVLFWNISGDLPAGTDRSIALTVRIRERPNIKYDETGSVSGEGYAYNRKIMSTGHEPYSLSNSVTISGDFIGDPNPNPHPDSDSVSITVTDPGTEIDTVEHGSGYYQQEQLVSYNNTNKSIRLDKKIFAKHAPTSLSLSRNRDITFNSLWFDRTSAKNYVRNEKISENYLYMDLINKESHFLVDPNQTVYKSTGDFYGGEAQISYTKTKPRTIPGLSDNFVDISEDYHGSFKIGQSLDSYGDGVSYSKSAKGQGFVASDKRIGKTQRSFEAGSGGYQSDEVIKTGVVYKDSTMTYAPSNQTAGSFKTNYSSKWHEEMRTSNRDIGATISERIGSADSIKKETLMQDADMALLAQFNGTADIKAVKGNSPKNETARIEQTFIGNYKLDTTIAINQGPIYIRPHINVTKEVLKQDDYTALFRINLTNDGNKTLGPIYITDRLPEGLTFINSSLRPDITGREIRWTLPLLQIGGKQSITLRASIKDTGARFINLVDVSAQYNGGVVAGRAACDFVLDWLPCCLTVSPAIRLHENVLPNENYVGGSWVPPKSFNLSSNMSEYPLDQEIPCSSCLLNAPENSGCDLCLQ